MSVQEVVVSNHHQFDDKFGHYQEFMSAFKSKLQMCRVLVSDKHAVQICLNRAHVSV